MLGGAADAMKQKALEAAEKTVGDQAPDSIKCCFPCCGGPVGAAVREMPRSFSDVRKGPGTNGQGRLGGALRARRALSQPWPFVHGRLRTWPSPNC